MEEGVDVLCSSFDRTVTQVQHLVVSGRACNVFLKVPQGLTKNSD